MNIPIPVWVAIVGAASAIVVALIQRGKNKDAPASAQAQVQIHRVQGKIEEPKPDEVVTRRIECSGSASDLSSGLHLWLVVEVNGLIWPKEGEVTVDGNGQWSKTIFEDGAIDKFSISLLVANKDAHKAVEQWFQQGQRTGQYERLAKIFGTQRIDRVDGLCLRNRC